MVGVLGLSVRLIDAGGKYIKEYETRNHHLRSASCYVASQVGQPFSIEVDNCIDYRCCTRFEFVKFRIFVDGIHVESQICPIQSKEVVEGAPCGPQTQRRFTFTALQTLEDEKDEKTSREDWHAWERFGTVEVRAHRVYVDGKADAVELAPALRDMLNNPRPIHPLSPQAGTHRTSLGAGIPQPLPHLNTRYIDPKDTPFATLRIYYRPQEILERWGYIPNPLAPTLYNRLGTSMASSVAENCVSTPKIKQEESERSLLPLTPPPTPFEFK